MELIGSVKISDNKSMFIYKLSSKYVLLDNKLTEYDLISKTEDEIISQIQSKSNTYEDIFDTALEAILAGRLVTVTHAYNSLKQLIKNFQDTCSRINIDD